MTGDEAAVRLSELEELCRRAVPIWQQQIDSAREQSESAIFALSQRFAALADKLDSAVSASRAAAGDAKGEGGGMVRSLAQSERQLRDVVNTLGKTLVGQSTMLEQLDHLSGFT